MRPLYCPTPPIIQNYEIAKATQVHWSILARQTEALLHDRLDLPESVGVLLTDKCTHALFLALIHRKTVGRCWSVGIPVDTYRAAVDAAYMAEMEVRFMPPAYTPFGKWALCDCKMPVTLGGGAIPREWYTKENAIIDAAHTGYFGMFDEAPKEWKAVVCLSFFPTKPFGAFGGGAMIGPKNVIEGSRKMAWPTETGVRSTFMYPQGIQSLGIYSRLLNNEVTANMHASWTDTATRLRIVLEEYGFTLRWPFKVPHIASFTHSDPKQVAELRETVRTLGYETGKHYEPLFATLGTDLDWVSLPFIYPDLPGELQEAYRDLS